MSKCDLSDTIKSILLDAFNFEFESESESESKSNSEFESKDKDFIQFYFTSMKVGIEQLIDGGEIGDTEIRLLRKIEQNSKVLNGRHRKKYLELLIRIMQVHAGQYGSSKEFEHWLTLSENIDPWLNYIVIWRDRLDNLKVLTQQANFCGLRPCDIDTSFHANAYNCFCYLIDQGIPITDSVRNQIRVRPKMARYIAKYGGM